MVSVIIPLYNSEKYIEATLRSVLDQKKVSKEIIVVDDGSKDQGAKVVEDMMASYPEIRLEKQENQGAPAARNKGIGLAKGDYLLFLDSDDIMYPDALEQMVSAMETTTNQQDKANQQGKANQQDKVNQQGKADQTLGNEAGQQIQNRGEKNEPSVRIDLVIGGFEKGDQKTFMRYSKNGIYQKEKFFDQSIYLESPFPAGKLYRTEIVQKKHILFDAVKIGQDLNFYLKYLYFCNTIVVLEKPVAWYRVHAGSISHSFDLRILDIIQDFENVKDFTGEEYDRNLSACRLTHFYTQMMKYPYFRSKKDRAVIVTAFAEQIRKIDDRYLPPEWSHLKQQLLNKKKYQWIYTSHCFSLLYRMKHAKNRKV